MWNTKKYRDYLRSHRVLVYLASFVASHPVRSSHRCRRRVCRLSLHRNSSALQSGLQAQIYLFEWRWRLEKQLLFPGWDQTPRVFLYFKRLFCSVRTGRSAVISEEDKHENSAGLANKSKIDVWWIRLRLYRVRRWSKTAGCQMSDENPLTFEVPPEAEQQQREQEADTHHRKPYRHEGPGRRFSRQQHAWTQRPHVGLNADIGTNASASLRV